MESDRILLGAGNVTDKTDGKRWIYKEYTVESLWQAQASWYRVVLISYDTSDDNTVRLDKAINTSLWRIPADVVILKTPYSLARDLYKAKQPNTIIFMDVTGKIVQIVDGGIYAMDSLLYYL